MEVNFIQPSIQTAFTVLYIDNISDYLVLHIDKLNYSAPFLFHTAQSSLTRHLILGKYLSIFSIIKLFTLKGS